jgi:DNA-binding SARP family transcriptional activator/predicted ATPase
MSALQVSLFGPPQLNRDGDALHIPRRKTLALLAYLVTTCRPHSRESLCGVFWPEDDPENARANLRRALSEIKQAIGGEVIDVDRSQVGVRPDGQIDLDVESFKQELARVKRHGHGSPAQCPACMAGLALAVDLYTGDFMAGFTLPDSPAFDEWQFFEAESLRQALGQSLEALTAGHAGQGAYERAIEYGRRWLALDLLHEPAHRQLMRLYALAGRKEAALRQYAECARVLDEELGIEPGEETLALYQAIRSGQVGGPLPQTPAPQPAREKSSQPVVHNLPFTSGSLIGRKNELERIAALLGPDDPCRLLTLTGPGGTGKTRLAVEMAARLARDPAAGFADGVWFISLAKVSEKISMLAEIARGLGFSFRPDSQQPERDLIEFLRQKQILLVLDDFDNLANEGAIGLLLDILAGAPHVNILVTSRTRLACRDEYVIVVGGLQTPGTDRPTAVGDYEAVQMFLRCATRIRADFALTPENATAVVRVCRLVDGMPLAIELAAAWAEVLSPAEIADEIVRSLDFLEARWQDLPDRQRSLRAVFESSWSALGEAERETLMALTVFKGGFTRQQAGLVAGASLKSLLVLAHRSWLGYDDATGRYSMHELLRQYAAENLAAAAGAQEQAMRRFCTYYNSFVEEQARALRGPGQREAAVAIEREFGNIQTAWVWQVNHGAIGAVVERMLPALYLYAEAFSRGSRLREMVLKGLDALQAGKTEANAARLRVILLTVYGAFDAGGVAFSQTATIYRPFERHFVMGLTPKHNTIASSWSLVGSDEELSALGIWGIYLAHLQGRLNSEPEQGVQALRHLASECHRQGQRWEEALALAYTGQLLDDLRASPDAGQGLEEEIRIAFSEALAIFHDLGDLRQSAFTLACLGLHAYFRDEGHRAIGYWETARDNALASGDRSVAAGIQFLIAWAYYAMCDYEAWLRVEKGFIEEYIALGHYRAANVELSWASLHLARIGDLKEARRLREQSLEYAAAREDKWAEAWQVWEMGELYRLEGDALAARLWYDRARDLFKSRDASEIIPNEPWPAFYERGLGYLAQMGSNFDEARRHFEESLRLAVEVDHDWAAAYALVGLGGAEIRLGRYREAGGHFQEAYRRASARRHLDLVLAALAGLAALRQAEGDGHRAASLASLIVSHPAAWTEARAQAYQILHVLGIELPAKQGGDSQMGCGAGELARAASMLEPELNLP